MTLSGCICEYKGLGRQEVVDRWSIRDIIPLKLQFKVIANASLVPLVWHVKTVLF